MAEVTVMTFWKDPRVEFPPYDEKLLALWPESREPQEAVFDSEHNWFCVDGWTTEAPLAWRLREEEVAGDPGPSDDDFIEPEIDTVLDGFDFSYEPVAGEAEPLTRHFKLDIGDRPQVNLSVEPEPPPVPGKGDLWAEAIEELQAVKGFPPEIIQLMQARRSFGIRRYGTPLQADNGRDHLNDALQEALDLFIYLHALRYDPLCLPGTPFLNFLREIHMKSLDMICGLVMLRGLPAAAAGKEV